MASSGKKKTTMAKLARENKLRERRADKQARKDARKQAAALGETFPLPAADPYTSHDPSASRSGEAANTSVEDGVEPIDPRAKEVALTRLRESPEEELAVFGETLRDDALEAGASEQEMRQAQRDHPGHGG